MNLPHRKIVFVHGSLGLGGAEVLRLSILQEMVNQGYDVEVVILRQRGALADRVEELGIPLTVFGNRGGLFDLNGIRRLARWLKQKQPDVVQSSQFLTNYHTRLACWMSGVRGHVIEEHGIYTWKKWYHRLIDRYLNARSSGVTACSHQVAKSAAADLGLHVADITVIHNCVAHHHLEDEGLNPEDRLKRRKELTGHPSPRHLVGIVGTLRWEKGHQTLFDAWALLHEEQRLGREDFLIVVGDGPLRGDLETRARTIPNICFLGSVPNTRNVLQALDLFVLPSHNEGFGIAIIEAMAARLPVVASDSGGIPEIIESEELGWLVPVKNHEALADSMAVVFSDAKFAQIVADNGARRVREAFSPAKYVEKLEELWQKLETR